METCGSERLFNTHSGIRHNLKERQNNKTLLIIHSIIDWLQVHISPKSKFEVRWSSNNKGSKVKWIPIIDQCFLDCNSITRAAVDRLNCFNMNKVKVSNLSLFYVYLQDVLLNLHVMKQKSGEKKLFHCLALASNFVNVRVPKCHHRLTIIIGRNRMSHVHEQTIRRQGWENFWI